MKSKFKFFVLSSVILYTALFLFANDMPSFGQSDNIEELKEQIKNLQKRIEELEAKKNNNDESALLFGRRGHTWDPFDQLARMQAEMDRMFEESFNWRGNYSSGLFGSNLFYDQDFSFKEEPDKYIMEFDITDMDEDKIEINISDQHVTLKCESGNENKTQDNENSYYSKSFSTFYKSFPLPDDADTLSMKTEKQDNKLLIILPKKTDSSKAVTN